MKTSFLGIFSMLFGLMLLACGCQSHRGEPGTRSHSLAEERRVGQANTNSTITSNGTQSAVQATYDSKCVDAIRIRWHASLINRSDVNGIQGKVVVEFYLLANGKIEDLKVVESNVSPNIQKLCTKAIEDAAPFKPWPAAIKQLMDGDRRSVRFTFHYNTPPQEQK